MRVAKRSARINVFSAACYCVLGRNFGEAIENKMEIREKSTDPSVGRIGCVVDAGLRGVIRSDAATARDIRRGHGQNAWANPLPALPI